MEFATDVDVLLRRAASRQHKNAQGRALTRETLTRYVPSRDLSREERERSEDRYLCRSPGEVART